MENNFFTVEEISSILKIGTLTIYKYIKEGLIEAIQLGGHYRIEKAALDRFIESHKVTASPTKTADTKEITFAQVNSETEGKDSHE